MPEVSTLAPTEEEQKEEQLKKLTYSFSRRLEDKYDELRRREYEPRGSSESEQRGFAFKSSEGLDWRLEQPPPPPEKVPYLQATENEKKYRDEEYTRIYPDTTQGLFRKVADFSTNPSLYEYYGKDNPDKQPEQEVNKQSVKKLRPDYIREIEETFTRYKDKLDEIKRNMIDKDKEKIKLKTPSPNLKKFNKLVEEIKDYTTKLMNNVEIDKDFMKRFPVVFNIYPIQDTIYGYIASQLMEKNPASAAAGSKRISKKRLYNILKNKTPKSNSAIKQLDTEIFKILNS